jgi:hypothetical protein
MLTRLESLEMFRARFLEMFPLPAKVLSHSRTQLEAALFARRCSPLFEKRID